MLHALILDKRSSVLSMQVCRALAHRGYQVDIFGMKGSPAFRSRFCHRVWTPDEWLPDAIAATLQRLINTCAFDVVYLCSEELLPIVLDLTAGGSWRGLPLSKAESLRTLLSKHQTLRVAHDADVAVPRTMIPASENDVLPIGRELGFPLLVKGERGDGGRNVRVVTSADSLLAAYREVRKREATYAGRPSLQQYVAGPAYSVGGLFHRGQPLRVCAHRKLLTFPPGGGWSVKGITERPPGLLEAAFKVFAALEYTGLGHTEFIHDTRDHRFKFIEINPRVWGSIGIAEHAGVELYKPLHALADGLPVKADLRFQEGIVYHRFSAELRLIASRPLRFFGFLKDSISRDVQSDFDWTDLGPHLSALSGAGPAFISKAHDAT